MFTNREYGCKNVGAGCCIYDGEDGSCNPTADDCTLDDTVAKESVKEE